MKRTLRYIGTAGILLGLVFLSIGGAYANIAAQPILVAQAPYVSAPTDQPNLFTPDELDVILGPIALYPDPLIAQILPASTFPDQLAQAADLIEQPGGAGLIDSQDWDSSVKAVAYYPAVVNMLADKPEWTASLGQAFVDQPNDVMASIQRLRAKARLLGYLSSNRQQRVSVDSSGYITIVPNQAQYIYVPQYNPEVVYVQRSSSSNFISFGVGFLVGSWLNRDMDWNHHQVFYHGWSGGSSRVSSSWVNRAKPHVVVNNSHYVSPSLVRAPIKVDRNVKTKDTTEFRSNVTKNVGTFKVPASRTPSKPRSNNSNNNRRPEDTRGGGH